MPLKSKQDSFNDAWESEERLKLQHSLCPCRKLAESTWLMSFIACSWRWSWPPVACRFRPGDTAHGKDVPLAVDLLSVRYFLWSSGVIEELAYLGSNVGSTVPLLSLRLGFHVPQSKSCSKTLFICATLLRTV